MTETPEALRRRVLELENALDSRDQEIELLQGEIARWQSWWSNPEKLKWRYLRILAGRVGVIVAFAIGAATFFIVAAVTPLDEQLAAFVKGVVHQVFQPERKQHSALPPLVLAGPRQLPSPTMTLTPTAAPSAPASPEPSAASHIIVIVTKPSPLPSPLPSCNGNHQPGERICPPMGPKAK